MVANAQRANSSERGCRHEIEILHVLHDNMFVYIYEFLKDVLGNMSNIIPKHIHSFLNPKPKKIPLPDQEL